MIRLVDPGVAPALAWLFTYLLHSTLWVGGVWGIGAFLPRLSARARSLLWRTALVAPLLSASLQVAAGASWSVHSVRLDAPVAVETAPLVVELPPLPLGELPAPLATPPPTPLPAWIWVVAAAGLFALGRLGLLARAAVRLRRGLGRRRPLSDRRVHRLFRRLRAGLARPLAARLTESDELASPIALGGAEVCLPTRAQSLDDRALAAVLGHELAHLERRDNLWLLVGALVEAVFFFQPLNRLARRGLQESAELASDERAVELTDDPLGLARSLAEVAGWGTGPDAGVLASPVVSGRGVLLRRVRSLLERDGRPRAPWQGPLVAAVLAAFALSLPSLGGEVQAAPPDARADTPAPALVPAPAPPMKAPVAPRPMTAPRPPKPLHRPALAVAPHPPSPPLPPAPPRNSWQWRDPGLAYVVVGKEGNATSLSASAAELRDALALNKELKSEYLWVRRHGQRVVITDPEAIASLRPLLEEQRTLRDHEVELGVSQAELARRQAELGQKQAQMGTKHAELAVKRAELGVKRAELEVKRMDLKMKARVVPRPHTTFPKDGPNELTANERQIAALVKMENELKAKQHELGRQQGELGSRQGELGRQQGELGRQQGELGRQQGELGRRLGEFARQRAEQGLRFAGELDRVVEQQLGAGKARVLDRQEPAGP